MTNKAAELLPCPFCGESECRIDENNYWTGQRNQLISVEIIHWCNKGTIDGAVLKIKGRTHEDAVNRWNTRAGDKGNHAAVPIGYIIGGLDERRREYEKNGTVMYHHPMGMATTPVFSNPPLDQLIEAAEKEVR